MPNRFFDTSLFPFVEILENNWKNLREEFLTVKDYMIDWPEYDLYEKGWKVIGPFSYPDGTEILEISQMMPFTTNLIKNNIPTHGVTGFSKLESRCNINPHIGIQETNHLRLHLGIDVPEGDIGFMVENEEIKWENGKCFVFNDRLTHRAWNNTDKDRIILLVDFIPDFESRY